jgi:hypothetical protein
MKQFASRLFSEGWLFLVPYVLVYASALAFNLHVKLVFQVFIALHFLNLILFLNFLVRLRVDKNDLFFWIVLFIGLLVPGVFLEFPADTWEHFRRIFQWQNLTLIDQFTEPFKFSYFFSWTTLSWVSLEDRRLALSFLSAAFQFMTLTQVYYFARALGFPKSWSKVHTFAFIALFGNSLFGLRYYGISSFPIAYGAYFRALTLLIFWIDRKDKRAFSLFFATLIMGLTHIGTLLYFLISGLVLIVRESYFKVSQKKRHFALKFGLSTVILGFITGFFFRSLFPILFEKAGLYQISMSGGFKIWHASYPYRDLLALHGLIASLFCLSKKLRTTRLAALTVAPVFVLIFPPSALAIIQVFPATDSYHRVLYAMPTAFMFVEGLRVILWPKIEHLFSKRYFSDLGFAALAVLITGLIPVQPVRGRLFFQLYLQDPQRSLVEVDQTALWIKENRNYCTGCWFITDRATSFVIATHLGLPVLIPRIARGKTEDLQFLNDIEGFLKGRWANAIIITDPAKTSALPESNIANWSKHWSSCEGDRFCLTGSELYPQAEQLKDKGWVKTSVPPNYLLYEAPRVSK